jgi:nitrogen fixation protein NifB
MIPLIPLPGTPLGNRSTLTQTTMDRLRQQAGVYLPQMRHCSRCRADAARLLGGDHLSALEVGGVI